jgi:hypothetical protein
MDGDPSVEPELDSFSRTLPLPYRVALLVVLGISPFSSSAMSRTASANCLADTGIGVWAWGANLQYLHGAKIVPRP